MVQRSAYCSQFDGSFTAFSKLCTVNPPNYSTGTCVGDSGGPLVAKRSNGQLVEIGIIDQGPVDCNTYTADYFANVISLNAWATGWIRAVTPGTTAAPSPQQSPPTQQSSPPPLRRLTFPDARGDVRDVLIGVLGERADPTHNYKARCSRSSAIRVTCAVSFWNGPNDYYGSVSVRYFHGKLDDGRWTDSFTIHWVNDQCYHHSGNRQRCQIHTRRGTW